MKKPTNLFIPGRWLCCAIGLAWLGGMLCHYFGAEAAVPWLLWAGALLSVALLVMLLTQLGREHRRDKKEHSDRS